MADKIARYGWEWDATFSDLEIEFDAIKRGGYWRKRGDPNTWGGVGLFQHYKNAMSLLWPEDDHHRWSDLILKTYLAEPITVVMGARDSGKTRTASKIGLLEYWLYPDETLIMVSSTDSRGADYRVWGDMKSLLTRAKERWPWLDGIVLEGRRAICTDAVEEGQVRDPRKGLVVIPCLGSGGQWLGMSRFVGIKQKRRRLIGDELQFMRQEYLDVFSNLQSGDFKGIFLGQPIGEADPLDRMGEPVGGWGSEGDITKTTVWKNKFGGATINMYGPDSPNFDFPQTPRKKYSYMVGQEDIDRVAMVYGKDSSKYWMQAIGIRKAGLTAKRVITQQICEQFGAFEPCIWSGGPTTLIAGLDAAYGGVGGDRCVLEVVEFGPGVAPLPKPDGMLHLPPFQEQNHPQLLKVHAPVLVPVSVADKSATPETQIAQFCKTHCESLGISPSNFFFDGRGALGASLGQVWSPQVNAVEFGGPATKRPVSLDHWTYDRETRVRRLKRADEEYNRFVCELWFSVRYTIMSGQLRELPREVAQEGCQREWRLATKDRMELETKAEMRERVNKSPDYFDALCLVENTMVLTSNGEIPIQNIKQGDSVITPMGESEVVLCWSSISADICTVRFCNGRGITGTSGHKVFTWNKRWVRLDALSIDNECESSYDVAIWHILNLFFTTVENTGFKAMVDTIRTGRTMRRKDFYTGLSGLSTMELFLKVIVSITKMGIGQITESKIWSWLKPENIAANICSIAQRSCVGLLRKLLPWEEFTLLNGMARQMAGRGTASTGKSLGLEGKRLNQSVLCADLHSKPTCQPEQCSVPYGAVINPQLRRRPAILEAVWCAIKALWRSNIARQKLVPLTVERLSSQESRRVYNITLKEHNAYYANGVLVQNCICLEGARRRGFQISKLGSQAAAEADNQWIDDMARKARELRRRGELVEV